MHYTLFIKFIFLFLLLNCLSFDLYACNTAEHHSVLSHYNHAKKIFEGKALMVGKENQKNGSFKDKATGMRSIFIKFEVLKNYKNTTIKEQITIGVLPGVMTDFEVGKKYLIYANAQTGYEFLVCEKGFETKDTTAMQVHQFLFKIPTNHTGYLVEYSEFGKKWAEGKLENGLPTSEWHFYAKSGELQIKGNYLNGEETGIWEYFYHTNDNSYRILNEIISGVYYKNTGTYQVVKMDSCNTCFYKYKISYTVEKETIVEQFCYNKQLKLKTVEYQNGLRHGKEIKFDEDGKTISSYSFEKDLLQGYFFEMFHVQAEPNSHLKIEGSYKNDEKYEETHFYYEKQLLVRTKIVIASGVVVK